MSGRLIINQTNQNINVDDFDMDALFEGEWDDDIGEFWNGEVPKIVNQSNPIPEPIPEDEIKHIKVCINNH